MTILRSIAMAFSCFSKLPAPQVQWKDENMRYMLAVLPLVGAAIGLVLWAWMLLCNRLGFSDTLLASGVTLLPVLLTGGIHLDGYCDTVDALSSHAEPARKLAILKDPHPGAFAVVFVAAYLLGYFALAAQLPRTGETVRLLALLHIMSRIVSAFAALRFPLAGEGGMLHACRQAADKSVTIILSAAFALCAGGMALVSLWAGLGMACIAVLTAGYVRRMSTREFGGMRGDLVGYLIAVGELFMLTGLVLTRGILEC